MKKILLAFIFTLGLSVGSSALIATAEAKFIQPGPRNVIELDNSVENGNLRQPGTYLVSLTPYGDCYHAAEEALNYPPLTFNSPDEQEWFATQVEAALAKRAYYLKGLCTSHVESGALPTLSALNLVRDIYTQSHNKELAQEAAPDANLAACAPPASLTSRAFSNLYSGIKSIGSALYRRMTAKSKEFNIQVFQSTSYPEILSYISKRIKDPNSSPLTLDYCAEESSGVCKKRVTQSIVGQREYCSEETCEMQWKILAPSQRAGQPEVSWVSAAQIIRPFVKSHGHMIHFLKVPGPAYHSQDQFEGEHPLHYQVLANHGKGLAESLKDPVNVDRIDEPNPAGKTPLCLAAQAGPKFNQTLEFLLQAGADPSIACGSGKTPLLLAAQIGNSSAVQLLLDHGARDSVDSDGNTALHLAALAVPTAPFKTREHASRPSLILENSVATLNLLSDSFSKTATQTNVGGKTPLDILIEKNQEIGKQVAKLKKQKLLQTDYQNELLDSVLDSAIRKGNAELVDTLYSKKLKLAAFNEAKARKNTLTHLIAQMYNNLGVSDENKEQIKLWLFNSNKDLLKKNSDGKLPLQLLPEPAVIEILREVVKAGNMTATQAILKSDPKLLREALEIKTAPPSMLKYLEKQSHAQGSYMSLAWHFSNLRYQNAEESEFLNSVEASLNETERVTLAALSNLDRNRNLYEDLSKRSVLGRAYQLSTAVKLQDASNLMQDEKLRDLIQKDLELYWQLGPLSDKLQDKLEKALNYIDYYSGIHSPRLFSGNRISDLFKVDKAPQGSWIKKDSKLDTAYAKARLKYSYNQAKGSVNNAKMLNRILNRPEVGRCIFNRVEESLVEFQGLIADAKTLLQENRAVYNAYIAENGPLAGTLIGSIIGKLTQPLSYLASPFTQPIASTAIALTLKPRISAAIQKDQAFFERFTRFNDKAYKVILDVTEKLAK